jgi:hypothetical protein
LTLYSNSLSTSKFLPYPKTDLIAHTASETPLIVSNYIRSSGDCSQVKSTIKGHIVATWNIFADFQ